MCITIIYEDSWYTWNSGEHLTLCTVPCVLAPPRGLVFIMIDTCNVSVFSEVWMTSLLVDLTFCTQIVFEKVNKCQKIYLLIHLQFSSRISSHISNKCQNIFLKSRELSKCSKMGYLGMDEIVLN